MPGTPLCRSRGVTKLYRSHRSDAPASPRPRPQQTGHRPRPIELGAQSEDPLDVQAPPSSERFLPHRRPERAVVEPAPAPAVVVLGNALPPDLSELPAGEEPGMLA